MLLTGENLSTQSKNQFKDHLYSPIIKVTLVRDLTRTSALFTVRIVLINK